MRVLMLRRLGVTMVLNECVALGGMPVVEVHPNKGQDSGRGLADACANGD